MSGAKAGPRARLAMLLAPLLASGCAGLTTFEPRDGAPEHRIDLLAIPDAVPRVERRSESGNPPSYVVNGRRYFVMNSARGYVERGIASWYGTKFHGRPTSSGEPYDMYAMSAAHTSLPLPSYVEVTNLRTGQSVLVRVNDRGPFHANRIIDLSYAAATKLGIAAEGTGLVEVRAITPEARPRAVAVAEQLAPPLSRPPGLYLQVGAFASRHNADRLRARLNDTAMGLIHVMPAINGSQTIYRVWIGPISSVEQADQLALTLGRMGVEDPHVVID